MASEGIRVSLDLRYVRRLVNLIWDDVVPSTPASTETLERLVQIMRLLDTALEEQRTGGPENGSSA